MFLDWFDPASVNPETNTMGLMVRTDMSRIIQPPAVGFEQAYDEACALLFQLILVLPKLEAFHANTKYSLYQQFKKIPKNKEGAGGEVNPGTDTYFKDYWLPAQSAYQRSREERDKVRDTVSTLQQSYIPRLRVRASALASAETSAMSNVRQPVAHPFNQT